MFYKIAIAAWIAAGSLSPLAGQTDKAAVRTLSLGGRNFPQLWVMNGKTPVELTFSPVQPSPPVEITAFNPLPIFKGDLNEKGMPADTSPAKVRLTPGKSQLLLGWMADNTPKFHAIPDDFASASSRNWLVVNTTSAPVAIQIGADTKPTPVKPGAHSSIRVQAPAGEGAAVVVASPKKSGEWKTIYSTYWPIYKDKRCLVLIVDDGRRPRVKVISDDYRKRQAAKAAAKASS